MTDRTEGFTPGDRVLYEHDGLKVRAAIVENVEGWWKVICSDGSYAIVRPSRLTRTALAKVEASGE